jgi:hypothetical protein
MLEEATDKTGGGNGRARKTSLGLGVGDDRDLQRRRELAGC